MGKTALIEDLRLSADGFRVLSARGTGSESRLPYAGLADVLRPVVDRIDGLPAAQAEALRAALALGPPSVADRFAAYAATLGLLDVLADEGPVLILIDDAHWLDLPSQEALLFCARRIGEAPVAIVAAAREVDGGDLDLSGLQEMRLRPLDGAAARRMLARLGAIDGAVAERVLEVARGNPLALIELPAALTGAERLGHATPPRALRAGEVLERAFRDRIEGLAPGARLAALLAAVSTDAAVGPIVAALDASGGGPADLAEAEAAGVVTLAPDSAHLRHPVLRPVVLGLATPGERRRAHRLLADALDPDRATEARAWHLADATVGTDEAVAAELEEAAELAAARTAYATAAAALERAGALSPDAGDRSRRRVAGAAMAIAAGRLGMSAALLDGGEAGRDARAAHLQGVVTMRTGDLEAAAEQLARAGTAWGGGEPERAAAMLADAVLAHALMGRCREALRTARRAYTLAGGPRCRLPTVLGYLGHALTLRGGARAARELIPALDRLTAGLEPASLEGQLVALAQVWRIWAGDLGDESARVDRAILRLREAGAVGFLPFPLAWACEVDFRLGRWARARARGEEALALLEETGQRTLLGYAASALATVEGGLGASRAARARAREAIALGRGVGSGSTEVYGAAALAFCAQGEGDPATARAALEPLADRIADDFGLLDPSVILWQPELVEAHARLGDVAAARGRLVRFAEQAHRTGGAVARASVHRCRGLIDDDFDRHFAAAMAVHERLPTPFERARTQLAHGARLRRAGRRAEARTRLERALGTFEDIGARPWARQAREEIAAGGARLRARRSGRVGDELSPRELQVALAVAAGATNREAAARLFLSEKTIERHLGSVYRKLGLRSRTELVRRLMRDGQAGPMPGGAAPSSSSESQ